MADGEMIDAPTGPGLYLLHFSEPIGNPEHRNGSAQHYLGYADDISRRLEEHRGRKSEVKIILGVPKEIDLILVRVWEGWGREDERRIKNGKNLPALCPWCKRLRGETHFDC